MECRTGSLQLAVDACLAAGLVMVLAVVFAFDRQTSISDNDEASQVKLEEIKPPEDPQSEQPVRQLRLGVTPPAGGWDCGGYLDRRIRCSSHHCDGD